jgi:hypothetical protein
VTQGRESGNSRAQAGDNRTGKADSPARERNEGLAASFVARRRQAYGDEWFLIFAYREFIGFEIHFAGTQWSDTDTGEIRKAGLW